MEEINGKKEFPSTTIYYSIVNIEQVVFIYGYCNVGDPSGTSYYSQALSMFDPKANIFASGEWVNIDINVTADFINQKLTFEGTANGVPVNDVVSW
jgi:hypothetical protein